MGAIHHFLQLHLPAAAVVDVITHRLLRRGKMVALEVVGHPLILDQV
jgi:hypothetical protein